MVVEAGKSAERSSIEIKDLLRKLHPERGNHKDRIRRLNKFRNYVIPNNQGKTPEFFDDDIPLLFLGASTPSIFLDEDDDLPLGLFYGLLFACGMPSSDGGGGGTTSNTTVSNSLKRSARHATNLVKWLLLDWKEGKNSTKNNTSQNQLKLNIFSKAFLSLPVEYYRHMRLDLHVIGDERGGTREDACRIIVLILMNHLAEDGERTQHVIVEELLTSPQAQQAYDLWSARNTTVQQQDTIKKNTLSRQAEMANRQKQDAVITKGGTYTMPGTSNTASGNTNTGQHGGADGDYDNMLLDESENRDNDDDDINKRDDNKDDANKNSNNKNNDTNNDDDKDDDDDDSYYDPDENDVMAAIRRRQRKARRDAEKNDNNKKGGTTNSKANAAAAAAAFAATRWEDSQVAREQSARRTAAAVTAASASASTTLAQQQQQQQLDSTTTTSTTPTTTSSSSRFRHHQQHDTVRDSQDAAAEAAEREEEKAKLLGRDPLGILNFEDYDLRKIELSQPEQIEQCLQDINEEIQKAESTANDETIRKAILQKESLEALVERMGGMDNLEQSALAANAIAAAAAAAVTNAAATTTTTTITNKDGTTTTVSGSTGTSSSAAAITAAAAAAAALQSTSSQQRVSILPTNPKFDPILFLTLLHRKTPYSTLISSLDRLSRKTENQAEQLQNLVRDNFPLFVRCAEGFEEFRRSSEQEVGLGVNERIEKLEAIAESCAYQAKKSFKPLLDNTSEVRKVQSALAVLNRVGPILQVPALMRQHIENRRYSQALKTYRRALVIDDNCNIELLLLVKKQAEECVRDARNDLERRLTQDPASASIDDLLNSIRDLGELLELDASIPSISNNTNTTGTSNAGTASVDGKEVGGTGKGSTNRKGSTTSSTANATNNNEKQKDPITIRREQQSLGIYTIGDTIISIRDHPPALACLLLQAAHFTNGTILLIHNAEETSQRIYAGETLTQVQNSTSTTTTNDNTTSSNNNITTTTAPVAAASTTTGGATAAGGGGGTGNQWKYDVLDARVVSTTKAVDMARIWLPRLVRIGRAAREDEKRRAARIGPRRRAAMMASTNNNNHNNTTGTSGGSTSGANNTTTTSTGTTSTTASSTSAFEVFVNTISTALTKLVEHAAFCALGSNTRTGAKYVEMTYGHTADEKLRNLLRSPLPPSQSTKVGKELADLVQFLSESSIATDDLRPVNSIYKASPLETCQRLGASAVVTIEKRRCIYAFDVCSRSCSNRASGSGKFDADSLLSCLKNLSEQLTRPEECSNEVEKGCELVVRRCCEGLAGYVRDRGDDARLLAVAECSDVMTDRIDDVIRETSNLTKNSQQVKDVILDDIMGLESAMFDEYLESIRQNVANSVKVGWLDKDFSTSSTNNNTLSTNVDPDSFNSSVSTNIHSPSNNNNDEANQPPTFPAYLSASLLAIARCRAQVEQALGSRLRRTIIVPTSPTAASATSASAATTTLSPTKATRDTTKQSSTTCTTATDGTDNSNILVVSYQHLAMATVADGVIEGICNEIMKRKLKLKVRQADRLANELEFLGNTLKKFITSTDTRILLKSTLQMVCTKAGRSSTSILLSSTNTGTNNNNNNTNNTSGGGGRTNSTNNNGDFQNDGPDGLAAIEELERLGRVYVLCLGE